MFDNHALVIGVSGLVGWFVMDQILISYPAPSGESPFGKVTALVNQPLNVEDAFWPKYEPWTPGLKLISGFDLLCGDEEFEKTLKENVQDISAVSHVFYFGELCTKAERNGVIGLMSCSVQRGQKSGEGS
jgi:hypothetical protein